MNISILSLIHNNVQNSPFIQLTQSRQSFSFNGNFIHFSKSFHSFLRGDLNQKIKLSNSKFSNILNTAIKINSLQVSHHIQQNQRLLLIESIVQCIYCVFSNCMTSNEYGGAIFSCSPTSLQNCLFEHCYAIIGGSLFITSNFDCYYSTFSRSYSLHASGTIAVQNSQYISIGYTYIEKSFSNSISACSFRSEMHCKSLYLNVSNSYCSYSGSLEVQSPTPIIHCSIFNRLSSYGPCVTTLVNPTYFEFSRCLFFQMHPEHDKNDDGIAIHVISSEQEFSHTSQIADCIFHMIDVIQGYYIFVPSSLPCLIQNCCFDNKTASFPKNHHLLANNKFHKNECMNNVVFYLQKPVGYQKQTEIQSNFLEELFKFLNHSYFPYMVFAIFIFGFIFGIFIILFMSEIFDPPRKKHFRRKVHHQNYLFE